MDGKHGTACQSGLTGTWPATAMAAKWSISSTPPRRTTIAAMGRRALTARPMTFPRMDE